MELMRLEQLEPADGVAQVSGEERYDIQYHLADPDCKECEGSGWNYFHPTMDYVPPSQAVNDNVRRHCACTYGRLDRSTKKTEGEDISDLLTALGKDMSIKPLSFPLNTEAIYINRAGKYVKLDRHKANGDWHGYMLNLKDDSGFNVRSKGYSTCDEPQWDLVGQIN
jgi:hypothetical protein